jgi:UDP-3-O-[3-hydroxymyristoyl] glucosamine N-acyltransferase
MLINYNPDLPLYLLGKGITSQEICYFISKEINNSVSTVALEEFYELEENSQCILTIHDMQLRTEFLKQAQNFKRKWPSYIHPQAFVVDQTLIGQGVIIWPFVYIGYQVKIGDFSSIAQQCNIGHGAKLGVNSVIAPMVSIGGSAVIGNNVVFGMSCIVKDKIHITDNVEFLMNSVVTKDIINSGRYYGNRSA